ncbi:MAG: hypothetical protein P8J27_05370 [Mariniblastus sp.]|nr:hypothetical protein [Mariniblastus sp.]
MRRIVSEPAQKSWLLLVALDKEGCNEGAVVEARRAASNLEFATLGL